MSYNTGYTKAIDFPIKYYIYNNFQKLELPYRHAQQIYRDQNLEKKDYINKSYILEEYKATYLAFLLPIKPDNISKDPTYNTLPR